MDSRERPTTGRRVIAGITEGAVWTLVLVAVWLATVTTITTSELVIAGVTALALAPLAVAARRALGMDVRLRLGWARWLVPVPGAVVADTGRLALAVVRAVRHGGSVGADRELALPAEDPARAGARAALAAAVVSATPGSYVVDVRTATAERDGALTVHALGARPSRLERAVTR